VSNNSQNYVSIFFIEKNEMGWACGTYGGRKRCAQVVGWDTRERHSWGDQDVGGRIILK
jgi:hypothetical protein